MPFFVPGLTKNGKKRDYGLISENTRSVYLDSTIMKHLAFKMTGAPGRCWHLLCFVPIDYHQKP